MNVAPIAETPTPTVQATAAPTAVRSADLLGHLIQPRGLAVTHDGHIVVCDFGNSCIQEFTRDLKPLQVWGGGRGDAPGQFSQPCGIAIAPNGEIFVADTWNARVQVLSANGKFDREWRYAFYGPRGITVDAKGSVFVADTGNNRIVRFSAQGTKEVQWGGKGSEPGHFVEPTGLTTDKSGKVYVCDTGNGRLQTFTRDGQFVRAFHVSGWAVAVYSEPAVASDPSGNLWVTVPNDKEIRRYDSTGKLLRTITTTSLPGVTFDTPMGITYSAASRELIVSDLAGRLVRVPYAEH